MLDETVSYYAWKNSESLSLTINYLQGDRFSSFGTSLMQTSRRAGQAFGIGTGSLKPWRIAMLIVAVFLAFWFASKVLSWWWGSPAA
jgi:hypothetical protein